MAAALAATAWPAAASTCAAGLSGVIMALLVLHVAKVHTAKLSVFGVFDVPARWYPVAMLCVFQVLAPGASFLGHLAGAAYALRTVLGGAMGLIPC